MSAAYQPATRRPRILCLAHRVPYPPNRGDRIRTLHQLRFLAQRTDVSLAFACQEEPAKEVLDTLRTTCARVAYAPLGVGRWARGAASLVAGRTVTEGAFYSPTLAATLRQWQREAPFDLAHVFCSSMAQYLFAGPMSAIPAIVDLIDVDSQKWLDYAAQASAPKRWLLRTEGRRLRRLEEAILRRAAAVLVVNRRERELLGSICPAENVHAIANGVDLEYFAPPQSETAVHRSLGLPPPWALAESEDARCVFVGALDYDANIDGVTWFCRQIWPLVVGQCADARFEIVGSRPGKAIARLSQIPGVRVVGEVEDVRPYVAAASVVVAPLRVARGLQNKILEAMAMAKPVVTTPQAYEGLDATQAGRDVCVATSPREWIATLLGLFANPARRREIGDAGRKVVEKHYRWSTKLALLAQVPPLAGLLSSAVTAARAATRDTRESCLTPGGRDA